MFSEKGRVESDKKSALPSSPKATLPPPHSKHLGSAKRPRRTSSTTCTHSYNLNYHCHRRSNSYPHPLHNSSCPPRFMHRWRRHNKWGAEGGTRRWRIRNQKRGWDEHTLPLLPPEQCRLPGHPQESCTHEIGPPLPSCKDGPQSNPNEHSF